jgi:predicted component of type VI protein secretion system
MPEARQDDCEAEPDRWSEQRGQDAAKLIERFGADGVDWLDRFLANYVFEGEPLDQVMASARQIGELPVRTERQSFNDD